MRDDDVCVWYTAKVGEAGKAPIFIVGWGFVEVGDESCGGAGNATCCGSGAKVDGKMIIRRCRGELLKTIC